MADIFRRAFHVRWGDMDFNGHMRNTAYLDTAGDVRMMFFEGRGFSMREFERLRLGPVVTRDELDYRREFRLLEQMDVTLELAGLSDDGSRFRLRNVFLRSDGKVAAIVTTEGGWFSLESRRLTVPPEPLLEAIRSLCQTDDFQVMPSGVRG